VLVGDLASPKNEAYRGRPVLAVEIRGTQSKRYLEEKVKLYLEHDWPTVWIAHAERHEVEVLRAGMASITYREGTEVPLVAELDKHGLTAVPVAAIFDDQAASRFIDEWVRERGEARGEARGRAQAVLGVLAARGLVVPEAVRARVTGAMDLATLDRWLSLAVTAASGEAFARAIEA
jgi:hypothetical protein